MGYLIDKKLKSTTIRCYVSAIKAVLRDDGKELNENVYLLKAMTWACRLHNDKVTVHLPIRKHLLLLLIREIDSLFADQLFLVALYKALFSTMYFGLFRISEITHSDHVLKARNVRMGCNKNKVMFILRSSKTHGRGDKPQTIKINSIEFDPLGNPVDEAEVSPAYCPFHLLSEYLLLRGKRDNDEEQFFVFSDRSVVTAANLRSVLKTLLIRAGFDHSIHARRTGDLLDLRIEFDLLRKLGRWKSGGAIYTYLKPS